MLCYFCADFIAAVVPVDVSALQVVIHEALMILNDCCRDTGAERDDAANGDSSSRVAALKFIDSVANTKWLSRPKYVNMTRASLQRRC